jgi:hypothetical protein
MAAPRRIVPSSNDPRTGSLTGLPSRSVRGPTGRHRVQVDDDSSSGPFSRQNLKPFVVILAIAGLALLLARSLADRASLLPAGTAELPACPKVIDAWANQRMDQRRQQLQQEHGLYRSEGEAASVVTTAMRWIDDRIIEHYLDQDRRQIEAMTRESNRCQVRLEP